MGLKKYEIITVGRDKRVRALRSWRVQDRYVNIGDVGGIVYDEKTLSQDGACWLFRGNFNFPGARIGGDSIVDVGEAAPAAPGSPNLDILGTSTVVGAPVRFSSDQTAPDVVTLTASNFEQGAFANYAAGQAPGTINSAKYIRTKNPIFMGGMSATLKLYVPGYKVLALTLDRDGFVIRASETVSGVGVTMTVPAGQYFVLRVTKDPVAAIVPADATAAQILMTAVFETKLVVVDSRVEVNAANATGSATIKPGGIYVPAPGVKYPDSIIRGSKVVINSHTSMARTVCMLTELVNVSATIDATTEDAYAVGVYHGVYNLAFTGMPTSNRNEAARSLIQAYNCDNMVVSPTNFPGLAAMQTAGAPIKFYNCNLNNGRFYHHAQIANTYRDINFDLAIKDLGKTFGTNLILVSSEVNGMYRAWFATDFGALIESYESVESLSGMHLKNGYNTTIYADAYLNGNLSFVGTNVFGNAVKHEASNTQNVMAVQGSFNTTAAGQTITGLTNDNKLVCVPTPFRINSGKGLTISNLPAGFDLVIFVTDANNKIIRVQGSASANTVLNRVSLVDCKAYIRFKKVSGDPITPDDVKGVTVTTYNGCKIVNTGETAILMGGDIRVEDNATLINTSVTGSGYFGGNAIIQAPSALAGQLPIVGAAYMSDNAVFAPSVANASAEISSLEMKDSAVFAGLINIADTKCNITMANNARFLGGLNTSSGFVMRGNSFVAAASSVAASCRGLLIMRDDARIESGDITAIGHITLCGKYTQTAHKTWTGKRVIGSQDAPTYDDNVKTQYDF